jgi:hypothetical protein
VLSRVRRGRTSFSHRAFTGRTPCALRDIISSSEAETSVVVMYIQEKEVVKQNVVNFC